MFPGDSSGGELTFPFLFCRFFSPTMGLIMQPGWLSLAGDTTLYKLLQNLFHILNMIVGTEIHLPSIALQSEYKFFAFFCIFWCIQSVALICHPTVIAHFKAVLNPYPLWSSWDRFPRLTHSWFPRMSQHHSSCSTGQHTPLHLSVKTSCAKELHHLLFLEFLE